MNSRQRTTGQPKPWNKAQPGLPNAVIVFKPSPAVLLALGSAAPSIRSIPALQLPGSSKVAIFIKTPPNLYLIYMDCLKARQIGTVQADDARLMVSDFYKKWYAANYADVSKSLIRRATWAPTLPEYMAVLDLFEAV